MDELKHSRHCVGGSNYHIQATPKYRRHVFWTMEARKLVEAVIRMKVFALGITLGAIEFGPDHVHLFLKNCEKYTVPELVGQIKGFSSYYLRKNYGHIFRRELWGDSLWSDGYFYESIGRVTSETVEYYIKNHKGNTGCTIVRTFTWMPGGRKSSVRAASTGLARRAAGINSERQPL
jgi:putative transposase